MNTINKTYFEKWILNSLSFNSSRHLFFNFNQSLIDDILKGYKMKGSQIFLPSNFYFWVFTSGESDINYLIKDSVLRISDSDLIEVRNTSEETSFVVLISDLAPVIIPSDNITSVSEKYYHSHKLYIDYICSSVFVDQFYCDFKQISELKKYIYLECSESLHYCFYKEIDSLSVLNFFGVIGNDSHFNSLSLKDSPYFKDFINRVVFVLNTEGFKGLKERLGRKNVTNYEEAIERFKNENYNTAKDFARNINSVFLRNSTVYIEIIDVDEWIEALKDEVLDDAIQFDEKRKEDLFSLISVANTVYSSKAVFMLRRKLLTTYLISQRKCNWFINNQEEEEAKHLSITAVSEIQNVKSVLGTEKKLISLINYSQEIDERNNLDFGVRIRDRYIDEKNLRILQIKEKGLINDVVYKLDVFFSDQIDGEKKNALDGSEGFSVDTISFFEIKDKNFFSNSDLDLTFRFADKKAEIDCVILEDENNDFKYNYRGRSEIETRTNVTDSGFKDVDLFLQNITVNRLYVRFNNEGRLLWKVFQFAPEGTKESVVVKNYFQKYQALNDSALKNRLVIIESRISNDIHSYYFENKFLSTQTYLPTIFNFDQNYTEVLDGFHCPYFLDVKKYRIEADFRPKIQDFNDLFSLKIFDTYLSYRSEITEWYQNKFQSYDIKSIDDIDFSGEDIRQISVVYLEAFNELLSLNENAIWLDTFYLCNVLSKFDRLDSMPLSLFFSPYNPILLYQLTSNMRLMRNTIENIKKPNSISALLKRNVLESWVLKAPTKDECYFAIETDSVLFTGFVSEKDLYENTLEPLLKKFDVSFSQGVGHLSSSQLKSALNKSYSYLSNKSTFNIKLEGKLVDASANESILEWIEKKTEDLNKLYINFILQINIFDNRDIVCYPDDSLISYYKEEKNINFNWYKGLSNISSFDLTLITSFVPDVSTYNQTDLDFLSRSFSYKNLLNTSLSVYNSNSLYRDIFVNYPNTRDAFGELTKLLHDKFNIFLGVNQFRTFLKNSSFNDSEIIAISSDVSNSYVLEEVLGKNLWEFSISDYSFKDSGKGDYFLLANEQEVYTSNFKKFLYEIDPSSTLVFEELLDYSKRTGLFELKYLISNQNFIKGFIASVVARKVIDKIITGSDNTFIIPFDVFKDRLQKIALEVDPYYKETGTQYPDFILIQLSNEDDNWIVDLRLIEIKYRNNVLSEDKISEILKNQTGSVKRILCTLNSWRYENETVYGLWVDSLSLILTEMSQFYFNNTLNVNAELKSNFFTAINEKYTCRINDSLLISLDSSDFVSNGSTDEGIYIRIPQKTISRIFSENEDGDNGFKEFFRSMKRKDTCVFEVPDPVDDTFVKVELHNYNSELGGIIPKLSNSENFTEKPIFDGPVGEVSQAFAKPFNNKVNSNSMVILGKDSSNREVVFYPKGKGSKPLPNYNIMVTGSSGKGKTQFIKSFIFQQGKNETSFIIIDFKNDYSDNDFCEQCNLKKISVKLQGIPYNPLIPRLIVDEDSGERYYDISEHINGMCSVLGSTFVLGVQQEANLKKAVREVFRLAGIESKGTLKYRDGITFPTFNEVGDFINAGDKKLVDLYNRLDPLFDLNLFPDEYKNVGFENIINASFVIKVSDIQADKVKNAIAKMVVVSAHGYYLSSEHKSNVSKYFVFDEAHRILDTEFVEKFIRECRAFGVGVLLSSQQPDDFPDDVLGQLATKIIHGNEGIAKLIKKIKDLISFGQDERFIKNLQTFEAIVNNQDYNNFIITTLAWPHLMILEVIKSFQTGVSFDDLNSELLKRGMRDSELKNLLQTLESKKYITMDVGIYKFIN